jgi:type VI protein secretion system component Hcp
MATKYFLLIDGINGGSTDKDHVGWFEIDSFEFDVSNTAGTGSGGGAGKAVFSPLEVALSLDPGLAGLLASVATGKHVKTVQLEGVTANGDTVYDLRLADVLVSKVDEGDGAATVSPSPTSRSA